MRLQKQVSRKSKDKIYPKFVIVVPPSKINKLGWKEGTELEPNIKNDKLVIKAKK